jgi:hypothetical protein
MTLRAVASVVSEQNNGEEFAEEDVIEMGFTDVIKRIQKERNEALKSTYHHLSLCSKADFFCRTSWLILRSARESEELQWSQRQDSLCMEQ